jgi:hypothetical protein
MEATPPLASPDSSLYAGNSAPTRVARWLQRRFYRYQPGAILAVFAVLVGVPLALDLFVPPVRDWLDGQAHDHEVGINLLEHVLVAALVAAAAVYWVLGLKRQKALNDYRSCARDRPWDLVRWSQREPPVVRAMSGSLANGIARSPTPAVAVVRGRGGTGRASFVVGLVQDLAKQKLIPIPVLARRDGSFELETQAREVFCRHIDEVVSSDQQADAIWRRAKASRDIVILVDGLDDEVVAKLWRDQGRSFQETIGSLRKNQIAVVLATTGELPLGDVTPLREDLDRFTRDEANRYLRKAIEGPSASEAVAALDQLPDPVDDALVAQFYLDLIIRLQKNGIPLPDLPEHTDPWRAAVIATYLDAIDSGDIVPRESPGDLDGPDARSRGRAAKKAAEALARKLTIERADLTVAWNGSKIDDRTLDDGDDLNLLWKGAERVGFAADDLGAYLVATTRDDPSPLLRDVQEIATCKRSSRRVDRHVLLALVFWHLRHGGRERVEAFEQLLADLKEERCVRPEVAAAAVRIGSACGLTEFSARIAEAVWSSIESLDTEADARRNASELLRLVRALAEWDDPEAHRLLWRLATTQNTEVEWPAAKALALARSRPGPTLASEIEGVLEAAEEHLVPAAMSDPYDELGSKVASLAWILPALRGDDELAESWLSRIADLCLVDDMSPLRGEMSLAQGLKLAIVNERAAAQNVAHVHALLFEPVGRLRFWHARLVLVQAILAHAWKNGGALDDTKARLDALRRKESHPLVKRGIELARVGLRDLKRSSNGDEPLLGTYMWRHERDVVRWVEQGKQRVTQLAADVVLLSNMTYRLRKHAVVDADRAAAESRLPRCIRKSSDRHNIIHGCECPHALCRRQEPPAVLATRARFSESFCREQARLVAVLGRPSWTRRGLVFRPSQQLKKFWDDQARIAQPEETQR